MTSDQAGAGWQLSPAALRSARFDQARRGYDRDQVHSLLAATADRLDVLTAERESLQATVSRLTADIEQLRHANADSGEETRMQVSVRAVELLSRAQQSADNAVAEAEAYARDLVTTAREQYKEILQRAHQTASQSTRDLPAVGAGAYTEPIPEVEYVRTYARVAQTQLRAVLEALTAEVDKLDRLPRAQSNQNEMVTWDRVHDTGHNPAQGAETPN